MLYLRKAMKNTLQSKLLPVRNYLLSFVVLFIMFSYDSKANLAEETFHRIHELALSAEKKNQRPIAVFDVDDTLFQAKYRNSAIFQDFALQSNLRKQFPIETEILLRSSPDDMRYDPKTTLKNLGIEDPQFSKLALDFWGPSFFSNDYLSTDRIVPGADSFVNRVYQAGILIVYLTGRDLPKMEIGTRLALKEAGFPLDSNALLMMKPESKIRDVEFKKEALQRIQSLGKIIAFFENEPLNLNTFYEKHPEAVNVLLLTQHSNRFPIERLSPSVIQITDFLF